MDRKNGNLGGPGPMSRSGPAGGYGGGSGRDYDRGYGGGGDDYYGRGERGGYGREGGGPAFGCVRLTVCCGCCVAASRFTNRGLGYWSELTVAAGFAHLYGHGVGAAHPAAPTHCCSNLSAEPCSCTIFAAAVPTALMLQHVNPAVQAMAVVVAVVAMVVVLLAPTLAPAPAAGPQAMTSCHQTCGSRWTAFCHGPACRCVHGCQICIVCMQWYPAVARPATVCNCSVAHVCI
jgi:hypothetical protein